MSDQWTAPGSDPTRAPELAPWQAPAPPQALPPTSPPNSPSTWPAAPAGPGHPGPGQPGQFQAPPAVPPGNPWRPGFEFRPGIVPLRPLALGDLYGGLIKAIRGNVAATIGLAAMTSVLFLVPFTALGAWVASLDGTSLSPDPATPGAAVFGDALGPGFFANYLPSIGSALSAVLLAGFMAYVIGQAVLGRKVSLAETWAGTKGRLPALVLATVVIGLAALAAIVVGAGIPIGVAVALGLSDVSLGGGTIAGLIALLVVWVILLVVAMLYITTRLSFMTSAIVLEKASLLPALARSWRLVGGLRRAPFWRIFGIRLLTSLLVSTASAVVSVPIMAAFMVIVFGTVSQGGPASSLYLTQTIVTGLVGILAGALTTPFTAGVDALLYVDARIRTEGLDVALMRASDGTGPLPWPSAAPS